MEFTERLTDDHVAMIARQAVFFVATAAAGARINLSPKGLDTFRVLDSARENVSVVGPLCTPLDLLADRVELPAARVGDLIAVLQSGAYGLSASPTAFLSHPPPGEVLV